MYGMTTEETALEVTELETEENYANNLKDGILFVGDLHLYNREMRSTKGYVENNEIMLKNLYTFIEENEVVKYVIFLGDIQHKTPTGKNTLQETRKWKEWFKKIGEVVRKRFEPKRAKVNMRDGSNFLVEMLKGTKQPLFTLQGNHDVDKEIEYTFYDELIEEGLLVNPETMIIDKTQINFHNYGETMKRVPVLKDVEKVIGIYHDVIPNSQGATWMKFSAQKNKVDTKRVLSRVDLAVVGDVHTRMHPEIVHFSPMEMKRYRARNNEPVIWYTGSMGRTSTDIGQMRDYGYCSITDVNDITIYGDVDIPVLEKEKYFDLQRVVEEKTKRREFEDFRLGTEDGVINDNKTPQQVVAETIKDPEIRDLCIELLDRVMDGDD